MGRLIRVELDKLRTVRAPLLLLLVSQLVVAGGVSGLAVSADDLRRPDAVPQALAHIGLVSLFALVLGVLMVAGEYRNRTITDTYLSEPRRGRVVTAKVCAALVAGSLLAVADAITAVAATAAWWAAKGVPFEPTGAAWRTVAGCLVWDVAFTVIGVGVGALTRNVAAGVAGALAWIALVEGIVGQLVGDLARWLPFASGAALADVKVAGAAADPLPQAAAGLVLAAYALLFGVVAVSTTVRRDVS